MEASNCPEVLRTVHRPTLYDDPEKGHHVWQSIVLYGKGAKWKGEPSLTKLGCHRDEPRTFLCSWNPS